ncbi:MAG TPA: DNA replication/repair protein RecF [Candidatus Nanopelagicales bacterium]|nr:DNA replication/repair protein RecF [Candidatus Nanopelagicales bacterium]
MWVQALSLTDFRSYPQADMEFAPGVTTFVGMNGQGKTNIVESLGYLATLSSHRVSADAPLIRSGAQSAVIRARVREAERSVTIDVQIMERGSNKARINASATTRARDVLGIVRAVVFAPEDLALVRGDPSDRRRFLDEIGIQRHPRLAGVRADYDKVLKQRNALMKSAMGRPRSSIESTLSVWNEQLTGLGADIVAARAQLINDLRPFVQAAYIAIAGSADVDITYRPSSPRIAEEVGVVDGSLRDRVTMAMDADLEARIGDELRRGITLVGPHRDEVDVALNGFPVKGYASHGESWSMALALRLAAADVLRSDEVDPIVILDDVFAELDTTRRSHLAAMVHQATQVFITAAVPQDVPVELAGARFDVRDGQVHAA